MNIKLFVISMLLAGCAAPMSSAVAQSGHITIPDFGPLEAKAKDCVNISLGPWLLHSVGMFMDDADPDSAATKKILGGIQSIQVRSFEFDTDNAYSRADLDTVRKQLNAPGWSSLLNVHDRHTDEDVDMYMLIQNEQTRGFALIASEPRKFTIVNIVGSINMNDLPKLEKQLHVGKLSWPAAAAQL